MRVNTSSVSLCSIVYTSTFDNADRQLPVCDIACDKTGHFQRGTKKHEMYTDQKMITNRLK